MGSFYGSCFATRQSIATGARCRIVALVQSTTLSPVEINVGGKTFTENAREAPSFRCGEG